MVKHKILPIPHAEVGEVLGLADTLYGYRCKTKISFLADELQIDIDDLGDVVEMARLLGVVATRKGVINLTLFGEALSLGNIDNKKKILREKMLRVEPFRTIIKLLRKAGGRMDRDELIGAVSKKFLVEDRAMFLKLVIGWGNYTETFEFDSDEETFVLSPFLI
jgi:hypothetical protein